MPPIPPDDRRCTATAKWTGQRCAQWAIKGTAVCRLHGGKAPQVQRKAAERTIEARANKILVKRGYERVEDPVEALADLAGEVVAAKDFFREQIEQLRYDHKQGEQLRAEVALYERALDRCLKVLSEITRLGIAERRARISEAQAVIILTVLTATLDRLELPKPQKAIAVQILQDELAKAGEESD